MNRMRLWKHENNTHWYSHKRIAIQTMEQKGNSQTDKRTGNAKENLTLNRERGWGRCNKLSNQGTVAAMKVNIRTGSTNIKTEIMNKGN